MQMWLFLNVPYVSVYTVSQKSSPFLFLWLRGHILINFNNNNLAVIQLRKFATKRRIPFLWYPVYLWISQNRETREILYTFSVVASSIGVVPVSRNFFKSLFSPLSPQPLFGNSVISSRWNQCLYQSKPNHRHQTVVCYIPSNARSVSE